MTGCLEEAGFSADLVLIMASLAEVSERGIHGQSKTLGSINSEWNRQYRTESCSGTYISRRIAGAMTYIARIASRISLLEEPVTTYLFIELVIPRGSQFIS